jgi:transcriptional regulator with XRE-family HTH domain
MYIPVMPKKKRKPTDKWPDRLKKLRARLGLSQAQAAARVSISQSQWSSFETGARQPTSPIARLIELLEAGTI